MAERAEAALRRLAAELRAELANIDRTVHEIGGLPGDIVSARVTLYAAAALLDTFYSGVERAFRRIAGEFGGVPAGSGWHRALLDDMALEIPKLRPAVLNGDTSRALARFLAFRHRFRNLYLFDLEPAPLAALMTDLPSTWGAARAEIDAFARLLEGMADAVNRS
jgi:hypothetical protein